MRFHPWKARTSSLALALGAAALGLAAAAARAGAQDPKASPTKPRDPYFAPGNDLPPGERVDPALGWLRRQVNVTYMRPQPLPTLHLEKLRVRDDFFDMLHEVVGKLVKKEGAPTSYAIERAGAETSLLRRRLGLEDGDELLSVDGFDVPETLADAKALHERLKKDTRFAIKVRRQKQEIVLSFYEDLPAATAPAPVSAAPAAPAPVASAAPVPAAPVAAPVVPAGHAAPDAKSSGKVAVEELATRYILILVAVGDRDADYCIIQRKENPKTPDARQLLRVGGRLDAPFEAFRVVGVQAKPWPKDEKRRMAIVRLEDTTQVLEEGKKRAVTTIQLEPAD